jgi:hypothetical protein
MESFQDQRNEIRSDIYKRLDALEDLLTEDLTRKLAQRRPKLCYTECVIMTLMVIYQEIDCLPPRKSNT